MGDSINEDIHIGGSETYVFRYIVDILKNPQKDYPNIHCHLYSRNAAEITELLAEKESITCEDLIGLPPICSRQSIQKIEGNHL